MRISDWSSDVCSSDLPVGEVVAAFAAGPRVVGDLVGRQTRLGKMQGGCLIEGGGRLLLRQHQLAAPPGAVERGALLYGELIERAVLGLQRSRLGQLVAPASRALARKCGG